MVASFLGGLVIGVAYYVGIFFSATSADLAVAPNQLVVILVSPWEYSLASIATRLVLSEVCWARSSTLSLGRLFSSRARLVLYDLSYYS